MSRPTATPRTSRAPRVLLVLLLAVLGALASPAAPASAHAELLRSTPADGAALSAPPAAVTLIFGEEVLADGLGMVATAADGTKVALGAPAVTGTKVVAAWPPDAPGGAYTVAWRVVSVDGHPISGVLRFSYPAAASPSATPSASPTPSTPTGAPSASPSDVVSPSASPASSSSAGSTSWPLVVGAAALLAVVVALVVVVARRRGGPAGGDGT